MQSRADERQAGLDFLKELDGLIAPELRAKGFVQIDDTFDKSSKVDIGVKRISVKRDGVTYYCIMAPEKHSMSLAFYYCKIPE